MSSNLPTQPEPPAAPSKVRNFFAPNRVAVYLTGLAGLATLLAPAVEDLDTSDSVALVGGLAGLVIIVAKWLDGWQKHEARTESDLERELAEDDYEGDDQVDTQTPPA